MRANCDRILAHLPKGSRLLAVVKAGGYGHGEIPVARAALAGGATGIAVATLEEAHALDGVVRAQDVLVMGGITVAQAHAAAEGGWSIAVSSRELASALGESDEAVPVHLKIDTGMGRHRDGPVRVPARGGAGFRQVHPRIAGVAPGRNNDALRRRRLG